VQVYGDAESAEQPLPVEPIHQEQIWE